MSRRKHREPSASATEAVVDPDVITSAAPPDDDPAASDPDDDDFAGAAEDGPNLVGDGSATSRLEEGDGTLPETGEPAVVEPTPADAVPERYADQLLDEEVEALHRADAARVAADELHAEVGLDVPDDGPTVSPPEDVLPASQPINVVVFDARGNVILGAINETQTGIDWTKSNAAVESGDLTAALAPFITIDGAAGYGVYNLVTGAVELFGRTGAAPPPVHREWWSTLVPTVPEVPPLHPDPDAFRAAKGAPTGSRLEAVPTPLLAELAGSITAVGDDAVPAPVDVSAALEPEPEPLTPGQHADVAFKHWTQLRARGPGAFDVAATAQGIAIAGEAARERRTKHPHSTPETSVAAVEALGETMRNLRHLVASLRHLAHAANGGVDVTDALASIDGLAAQLVPEL